MNSRASGKRNFTLTMKINIPETMPKVIGTQIHKRNTLPESGSNNYQITITILLLYHLICELDYRIDSSRTTRVFNGLIIALAKVMAIVHQPEKFHWKVFFFAYLQVLLGIIYRMHYH